MIGTLVLWILGGVPKICYQTVQTYGTVYDPRLFFLIDNIFLVHYIINMKKIFFLSIETPDLSVKSLKNQYFELVILFIKSFS
jgi:hypothetical protein